jgi:hypothetical protein
MARIKGQIMRVKVSKTFDAIQFNGADSIKAMRKTFTAELFDKRCSFIEPHKQIILNSPCGTLVALTGDWVMKMPGGFLLALKDDAFQLATVVHNASEEGLKDVEIRKMAAAVLKEKIELDALDVDAILAVLDTWIVPPKEREDVKAKEN